MLVLVLLVRLMWVLVGMIMFRVVLLVGLLLVRMNLFVWFFMVLKDSLFCLVYISFM